MSRKLRTRNSAAKLKVTCIENILQNIGKFCQFCLNLGTNLVEVGSAIIGRNTYVDLFKYLVGDSNNINLDVSGRICEECGKNLVSAYNFKQKCLDNLELINRKFTSILTEDKDEAGGTSGSEYEKKTPATQTEFTCGECGKILSSKSGLKSHLFRHKHGNEYKCSVCQEVFKNFNARKRHVNLVHLNRKIYQCLFCEESFQYNSTHREHIRKVHEREQNVECPKCPKKFYSEGELLRHRAIHDFVPRCQQCGKTYKDIRILKKHMKIFHNISNYQPPELSIKLDEICPEDSMVTRRTFSCEKCQKVFKGPINLEKHLKTVHREWLCTECGKVIKGTSYSVHMNTHTENPQICPDCGKAQNSAAALKRHQKRVHGPKVAKSYDCPQCNLKFVSPHTRRYHVAKIHTKKPLYVCHCGQEFLYHHVYKRHERRDHTGDFPYDCDICPKKFLTLAECRRHRQSHSTERSFKCRICEKDFKTDVALYIHMKSHRTVER